MRKIILFIIFVSLLFSQILLGDRGNTEIQCNSGDFFIQKDGRGITKEALLKYLRDRENGKKILSIEDKVIMAKNNDGDSTIEIYRMNSKNRVYSLSFIFKDDGESSYKEYIEKREDIFKPSDFIDIFSDSIIIYEDKTHLYFSNPDCKLIVMGSHYDLKLGQEYFEVLLVKSIDDSCSEIIKFVKREAIRLNRERKE